MGASTENGKAPLPSEMSDEAFQACLEEAMNTKKKDLKLTKKEEEQFMSAMKKPEFTNLMKEYMDDISDPKHRAEQEQYLRQLEAESKIPGDMQLIHPTSFFCIKFKLRKDMHPESASKLTDKLFINVCSAKEVEPATSRSGKKEGVNGAEWFIPHSIGPMRYENDKSGNPQMTFDVAVNTHTELLANKSKQFKDMLVTVAMEAVQQRVNQVLEVDVKLEAENARVLKGVRCIGGKPAIMQLKKVQGSGSKGTEKKKKGNNKKKQRGNKTAMKALARKSNEPKYTITHRGQHDLAEYCATQGMKTVPTKRPKELVIRIYLQKLQTAREVDLDISTSSLRLKTRKNSSNYELELPLPFPVKDQLGTAKFDQSSHCLTVTLPVVPAQNANIEESSRDDEESRDNAKQDCEEVRPAGENKTSKSSNKSASEEVAKHSRWICNKARSVADPAILEAKEAAARTEPRESDEESAVIVSPDKSSDETSSKDPEDNWILLNESEAKGTDRVLPRTSPGEKKLDSNLTTPLDTMVARADSDKSNKERFIPAESFNGEMSAYSFKEGSEGPGYYLNSAKVATKEAESSSKSSVTQSARAEEPTQHAEESVESEVEKDVTGLSSLQLQNRDVFRLD